MNCPECGTALVETTSPLEEEFKGETLKIDGILRWECPSCGEYIISAEESDKFERALQRKYREALGLLLPEEIVELRKKRGWSQKELERIIGVTSPSVSRWETGRVVQSKPCDLLMRCLRDHECVASDLSQRAEVPNSTIAFSASDCVSLKSLTQPQATTRSTFNVR